MQACRSNSRPIPAPAPPTARPKVGHWRVALGVALVLLAGAAEARAAAYRIKDIADFEGVRDNLLVGYGLVVGLDGTGDSLSNSPFTRQSLESMLERLGVNVRENGAFSTKNVAAVMVSATLPPFARQGTRIDTTVSALGDAKSLLGGNLLVTPLMGADGEVYAVSQGPVAIGGFKAQGAGGSVTRGVPTGGRIANGGIVEREIGFSLASLQSLHLSLRNPDITTAAAAAHAISGALGGPFARPIDPATVVIEIPHHRRDDLVGLMMQVEQLRVETDQAARVVIDEKSGIIVMGANVRIDTVAIAQGSLTIRVTETPQVSQPGPFAPGPAAVPGVAGIAGVGRATGPVQVPRLAPDGTPVRDNNGQPIYDIQQQAVPGTGVPGQPAIPGQIAGGAQTVVVPRTDIQVDEQNNRRLAVLPRGVSLQELVDGLNALGVGPRDMIAILQAIKAAGALQAEIEVM
jgi:flagellar P-ring protein FlgI